MDETLMLIDESSVSAQRAHSGPQIGAPGSRLICLAAQIRLRYMRQLVGSGVTNVDFESLLHDAWFAKEAGKGHIRAKVACDIGLTTIALPQPVF